MNKLRLELNYLSSVVSSRIPEGRFKERLRALFWRRFDPLTNLEAIVADLEMQSDKTLLCALKDGTKIYGLPSETKWMRLNYMDNLGKMELFKDYGSMMSQLCEIWVDEAYERHYTPKEGDVVVDVGANVGIFTVKMAKAVGDKGRVIAMEPDHRNIACLRKNIEVNDLRNVTIVRKGAWDSKGLLKLNLFSGGTGFSSFHDFFYPTLGSVVSTDEVEVDTLDNILGDLGIRHVDFLKMDIEGAEVEAVEGMSELSKCDGLRVVVAAYHIVDGKVTCKGIMKKLKVLGLEVVREGAMVYAHKP